MYYILISNENHVKWSFQMSNIHYTLINNGQTYIIHNQLYIGTVSINKTKVNKCPHFVRYCVRGLIKSTDQCVDLVCLIWSLIWISRLWKHHVTYSCFPYCDIYHVFVVLCTTQYKAGAIRCMPSKSLCFRRTLSYFFHQTFFGFLLIRIIILYASYNVEPLLITKYYNINSRTLRH